MNNSTQQDSRVRLRETIIEHAETIKLDISGITPDRLKTGIKSLGVLNPKIPNAFCQASPKTISPKLAGIQGFPGISILSVPFQQKYDWAGGAATDFRLWRFLITPVAGEGRAIIDDLLSGGPLADAFVELVGGDWSDAIDEVRRYLNRDSQSPSVASDEKQVYFVHDQGELLISPLADPSFSELLRRIKDRTACGEVFDIVCWKAGGVNPFNSGVVAGSVAGWLWKLITFAPSFAINSSLPPSADGTAMVIEFEVPDMNAEGAGVTAGPVSLTAVLGFVDALRRKIPGLDPVAVAAGFSHYDFHGERNENGSWSFFGKRGTRPALNGKGVVAYPVPEMSASAKVHIALRFSEAVPGDFADEVQSALPACRFAGSSIFAERATVVADAAAALAVLDSVPLIADAQHEIDGAAERLDAALGYLARIESETSLHREQRKPGYFLAATGFQCIEPPQPRNGLKGDALHAYAAPILKLAQWVHAKNATSQAERVWWRNRWDADTYSAHCEGHCF